MSKAIKLILVFLAWLLAIENKSNITLLIYWIVVAFYWAWSYTDV